MAAPAQAHVLGLPFGAAVALPPVELAAATALRPPPQRIQLPRSTRRYRFSMTAMADMMFQLLIFFMLSAQLTPYSMLDLAAGAAPGDRPAAAAGAVPQDAGPATPPSDPRATAVWTIQPDGGIVAGGQRFTSDRLGAMADALRAQQTARVVLVARPGVDVQRVVTVLETLAQRGIADVQIAAGHATSGGPSREAGP